MRLSRKVLKAIDTQEIRMKIGIALGKSDDSIKRYIKTQSDNLTKVAALEVIKNETGMDEGEILQQVKTCNER
jgi:hypothetical protein